jgi:hypothetical protein
MADGPQLSNVRELFGFAIGQRIVDITAGDPPQLPDADPEDANDLVIHLEGGGTLTFCADCGATIHDPDSEDDDE